MKNNFKQLRSHLLELLTHKVALPVITRFRKKINFSYSFDDLLQLPAGTLGNDLALYLQKKNFELLPNYERHDCKHIILNFEMDEVGEARMQWYFFGNGRYSLPVILTIVLVFVLMPEHWRLFFYEFRRGRNAPRFNGIDFNELVELPTEALRKRFASSLAPVHINKYPNHLN